MYVPHMSPDMCVGKIFQALVALSNQSGFIKVLSHVVPHLLKVMCDKSAGGLLLTFVLNIHLGMAAPPVFNESLMVLTIFPTTAAASEGRRLKHPHPLLFWGKCPFPP